MRRTMAWVLEARLGVVVHGPVPPSQQEWDAFVRETERLRPVGDRRFIVRTHGGGPDVAQRKQLFTAFNGQQAPTAFFPNGIVARGIGIAVSWFNPLLKVFGPEPGEAAFDYLELTQGERLRARALLQELERVVGVAHLDLAPETRQ